MDNATISVVAQSVVFLAGACVGAVFAYLASRIRLDRLREFRAVKGSQNKARKARRVLSKKEVREIEALLLEGEKQITLSGVYETSTGTISRIYTGDHRYSSGR